MLLSPHKRAEAGQQSSVGQHVCWFLGPAGHISWHPPGGTCHLGAQAASKASRCGDSRHSHLFCASFVHKGSLPKAFRRTSAISVPPLCLSIAMPRAALLLALLVGIFAVAQAAPKCPAGYKSYAIRNGRVAGEPLSSMHSAGMEPQACLLLQAATSRQGWIRWGAGGPGRGLNPRVLGAGCRVPPATPRQHICPLAPPPPPLPHIHPRALCPLPASF